MKKKLPYLLPSFVFFLGAPLVWFLCFRDVPLRVSPETTHLTQPLTKDGQSIDWFRAIKERFEPKCKPEDNGFRMVAAALGRSPYFDQPDWYWPELCKALDLDPNLTPTLTFEAGSEFFKREYLIWLDKHETIEFQNDSLPPPGALTDTEKIDRLFEFEVWTAEDYPFMARWVEESSPLLDLVGEALKKEQFFVPMVREKRLEGIGEAPYSHYGNTTFPRYLEQAFFYRKNYRLGLNDLDGAWQDGMSITRKRIHHRTSVFFGPFPGHFSAHLEMVLHDRTLSESQRAMFLADLERLPKPSSTEDCLEFWRISSLRNVEIYPEIFFGHIRFINWNILAREINRYVDLCETAAKEIEREPNPAKQENIVDDLKSRLMTPPKRSALGRWLGKPITVAERSREFAWADQQAYFQYRFPLLLKENEKAMDELRKRLENGRDVKSTEKQKPE